MAYTRVAREKGTLNVPLSTAEKRIRDGKGRTPIDVSVTITWTVSPDDWAVAVGEDDMTVAAVREAVRTEIENGAYPPPDREQIVEFDVRVARTPRALNAPAWPSPPEGDPMSETDTTEVLNDDDRRVYDGAVARVRSARDRAIDLAEAILHATSPNAAFMNPVTEQDREQWRSEIDRLKRMADRSDIWFREQP